MTTEELQKLIDYIEDKVPKYFVDLPDQYNNYAPAAVVKFDDIMELLTKYASDVMSKTKAHTAGPDYESMYNSCLDSLEELRNENRRLKERVDLLNGALELRDARLDVYSAALNTVEVMTGNRFRFMQQGGTE